MDHHQTSASVIQSETCYSRLGTWDSGLGPRDLALGTRNCLQPVLVKEYTLFERVRLNPGCHQAEILGYWAAPTWRSVSKSIRLFLKSIKFCDVTLVDPGRSEFVIGTPRHAFLGEYPPPLQDCQTCCAGWIEPWPLSSRFKACSEISSEEYGLGLAIVKSHQTCMIGSRPLEFSIVTPKMTLSPLQMVYSMSSGTE